MAGRAPNEQQSYEIGRRGDAEPYGLDLNERDAWQQGRKDRKERLSPWPEPAGGGGGGGVGLVVVLAILGTLGVIIAIAVSAGIAGFASAALLYVLSRLWPGLPKHAYWEAYGTAFLSLVVFILLLLAPPAAAHFLVEDLRGDSSFLAYVVETTPALMDWSLTRLGALALAGTYPPEVWFEWLEMARPDADRIVTWAGVLLLGPALVGAMIVAAIRIEFPSSGASLLGSAAVALLAILPGAALGVSGLAWLVRHAQPADLAGIATLGKAALAGGVMVLAYALLGALTTGLVLYLVVKLSRGRDVAGYGHMYRTAFLGLLACGVVTILALFWFRGGDGLWAWSAGVAAAGPANPPAIDFSGLWRAIRESWPVIVPGLIVAGAIVSARHPAPFSGTLGYGGAVAVSAVTAVPLLIPCLVAGVELARRGLLD